jgi:hypothetical protein
MSTRASKKCTRALRSAAAAIALLPGLVLAQWWNPASPMPPGKWAALESTFRYTAQTRDDAVRAIGDAAAAGDTAKLDRMHEDFLGMLASGGNGSGMMEAFRHAVDGRFVGGPRSGLALFDAWRQAAPDSKLRPALEAAVHWRLAWEARGSGLSGSVTDEGGRIFRDELDRAAKVLKESGPAARQSPLWYWIAVSIAGSRGEPPQVLDGIFAEGVQRFPRFLSLYETRMNFLMPQWGGSFERVDAFIREAVLRTQAGSGGTWIYARLYAEVYGRYRGDEFFRKTKASWPLMRHAFEDEAAYGTVDLNEYATFACVARDRETTARLLAQLGPRAALGLGREGLTTEGCIELVKEGR